MLAFMRVHALFPCCSHALPPYALPLCPAPMSLPPCAASTLYAFIPPPCALPPCAASSGTFDQKREGQAGGFKELDETELEEARKRRAEFESKDM